MDIKLLVLDVDGTLTDSMVYYGNNNIEIKAFSTKDGAAIKPFRQLGFDVVFLTGRESEAVNRRATDLGVTAIQGVDDKLSALHELITECKLEPEQCAYIGDDFNDYAAMNMCGFKACPSDAAVEIKSICDYISPIPGGHGAVRDICDYLLRKLGKYGAFLELYGIK